MIRKVLGKSAMEKGAPDERAPFSMAPEAVSSYGSVES